MFETLLVVLMGLGPLAGAVVSDELAVPIRIEADGKPIDTETGHAAPT